MSHTRNLHDYPGNFGSRKSRSKYFKVVIGEGQEIPIRLRDAVLDMGKGKKVGMKKGRRKRKYEREGHRFI